MPIRLPRRNQENDEAADGEPLATPPSSGFVWKGVLTVLLVGIFLFFSDSIDISKGEHQAGHVGGGATVEIKSHVAPAPAAAPAPTADASSPVVEPSTIVAKTYTYKPRGRPLTDEQRKELETKWGSWTLLDDKRDTRPSEDFYLKYKNRDVPRSEFPATAWQTDKDYLDKFLPEALALVERAQEAILAEYGKTEGSFEERASMFQLDMMDNWDDLAFNGKRPPESASRGGFTNKKSWEGFVRRTLHAVMTEDSFVFAMGGHSAAAAHGNHFTQSYTLQVQWLLEAVFARLGVKHEARNFGMGGLGTGQAGMAAGSLYGPDVDILMWDSSMTEGDKGSQDLLHRQYILGAEKVPILWSLAVGAIKNLHIDAGVDVGYPGDGRAGLVEGKSVEEFEAMPWAAQYLKCTSEMKSICREREYDGVCWIPRDDVTVDWKVNPAPGGRAGWHPGNRHHQLRGRVLAFTILSALKEGLTIWKNADGYALPDETWHVTAHYDAVKAKLPETTGACNDQYGKAGLEWICKYPVKGRTEFTPRVHPSLTSIRTLLHPEQSATLIPQDNFYEPPDIFNPSLHPPEGAVDALNIVELGKEFDPVNFPDYTSSYMKKSSVTSQSKTKVELGKGLYLNGKAGDPYCDGTVNSFCARGKGDACPLYGHNDGRNGIHFDGFSGWIVMTLPDVKSGHIAVKYHSWHQPGEAKPTEGWKSINNETSSDTGGRRRLSFQSNNTHVQAQRNRSMRRLKQQPAEFCDDFHFEYAIDGQVTTLSLPEWQNRSKQVQRVVEILTVLDDPSYTGGEEREVEVAVRITGCARVKTFSLTHVYWS